MEKYPVTISMDVRWRDGDALGHVNNAVFLTYFETARIAFLKSLYGTINLHSVNFVIAQALVDFVRPVFIGETIEIGARVKEIGRSSFVIDYLIRNKSEGYIVAKGETTQVFYDFQESKKMGVTKEWVDRVELFQGGEIPKKKAVVKV